MRTVAKTQGLEIVGELSIYSLTVGETHSSLQQRRNLGLQNIFFSFLSKFQFVYHSFISHFSPYF
jgi:hypothetical protein